MTASDHDSIGPRTGGDVFRNPVLGHDLRALLGSRQSFLLLWLFVTCLGLVLYLGWPRTELMLVRKEEVGAQMFLVWAAACLLLFAILGPLPATQGFLIERRVGFMELIAGTPLRPGQLVWGKIVASVVLLWILILASFPIAAFCLVLGGVSVIDLLFLYAAFLLAAWVLGMVGVAASLLAGSPQTALAAAYLVVGPVAAVLWIVRDKSFFASWLAVTLALGLMGCGAIFPRLWQKLRWPAGEPGGETIESAAEPEADGLPGEWLAGHVLARAPRSGPFAERPVDPVAWAERVGVGWRAAAQPWLRRLVLAIWVAGFALVLVAAINALARPRHFGPGPGALATPGRFVAATALFLGAGLASGTIVRERQQGTLDMLRMTGLSPTRLLLGKIKAVAEIQLRALAPILLTAVAAAALSEVRSAGALLAWVGDCGWWLAATVVLGGFGAALGAAESAWSRDDAQALVRATTLAALPVVGPWGIAQVGRLFTVSAAPAGEPADVALLGWLSGAARAPGAFVLLALALASALLLAAAGWSIEPFRSPGGARRHRP